MLDVRGTFLRRLGRGMLQHPWLALALSLLVLCSVGYYGVQRSKSVLAAGSTRGRRRPARSACFWVWHWFWSRRTRQLELERTGSARAGPHWQDEEMTIVFLHSLGRENSLVEENACCPLFSLTYWERGPSPRRQPPFPPRPPCRPRARGRAARKSGPRCCSEPARRAQGCTRCYQTRASSRRQRHSTRCRTRTSCRTSATACRCARGSTCMARPRWRPTTSTASSWRSSRHEGPRVAACPLPR